MKKRTIVLLLTSLLFPALLSAGCGSASQDQEPSLKGHYKATVDMKDQMNKGLGGIIRVDKVDIDFHLNLDGDSHYRLYTEEDQVKDSITAALTDALKESLSEKEIRDIVDKMDSSNLAISKEGVYKIKSDGSDNKSIVFDPDSDSPQTGLVSEDSSTIKTSMETDDSQALEMTFRKVD